jgi:glyoxylase-like metal-dependent hydrolase (beta-lactamase superfamily II)
MTSTSQTIVHRHVASAMPVNAYVVETRNGAVVIDGTLTVSDGRAVRERVEQLNKPLLAVLVTHAHPDHYRGIVEVIGGDEIPVVPLKACPT